MQGALVLGSEVMHVCMFVFTNTHTRGNISIYICMFLNTYTPAVLDRYKHVHTNAHATGKDSGMSVLDRAAQLRAHRDSQESSASVSVGSRGRQRSPARRRRGDASLSVLDRAAQRRAQKDEI